MTNRVLIITGDAGDAKVLKAVLSAAESGEYIVEWVRQLSEGLKRLLAGDIDLIVADLALSDSQGIATFERLYASAPHAPIVILTAPDQESLTSTAIQQGAQGYLSKGNLAPPLVPQYLQNLIRRKSLEETYYLEKTRAEITLNSINDAVIGTDMLGNVEYLNIAAETLTGWSREAARGRPVGTVMRILDGTTREPKPNPIDLVLRHNKTMALTTGTILICRDGHEAAIEDSVAPIHDWDGKMTGAVIVFHDITVAQSLALKMAHLAQHDFLTNLPNRILLNDRIEQAISRTKRQGTRLAVLFLDLDSFKHINDSFGHSAGDMLLQSVADRLCACVRGSDTVSRQGGDEFVILVTEDRYVENAALIADKILSAMAAPHFIAEQELYVSTSIGISVYPEDGQDAETLIQNADTAMYNAKEKGRNNYQYFKREMNARVVERQTLETQLRQALHRQEFVLHYQSIVNLETSVITGVEALLRWQHPQWGLTLPGRFLPVAESSGMMVQLGRWVLREACLQAKRWYDVGLLLNAISVNISASEFCAQGFLQDVRMILSEIGLAPRCLQLEITENMLMRDVENSSARLDKLKEMGIQVAVDDFGAGFSNLSYLARLPIDVLKIAPAFVHDIGLTTSNNGLSSLASAVIAMAVGFEKLVVAEGVEDHLQWAFLKVKHCDEGQGYLFSRPMAAAPFTLLLSEGIPTPFFHV
ncbi:EAL domain-containing protein [Desulfobulbus rhabdoformis]|uniref:putative bifunctional diguanylate cyclase/phosphodiesterase n=1 Tax=Desulfobulbus rhabdoformis TaxID=34032 RepID=UPI00196476E4|nr:EAL domain-containing protein [Desulfobulbus rhabdoformis]MBM9616447.1 EAL domain-containing protein [Desulfobulbus rhabdoformis]